MSTRSIFLAALAICIAFLVLVAAVLFVSAPGPVPYAVLWAAESGNVEKLEELLEANPTLVNAAEYGETALHRAANKGVAQLLIARGADVNANECGWMPLHSARTRGVAEVLVAAGADVNAKSHGGRTPLHDAATKDIAEFLIAKGADICAKDDGGQTPLHTAIENRRRDVAEFLVVNKANVDIFAACALGLADTVVAIVDKDPNLIRSIDRSGGLPYTRQRLGPRKKWLICSSPEERT